MASNILDNPLPQMETTTTTTLHAPDLFIVKHEFFDPDVMADLVCDDGFAAKYRKALSEYNQQRTHGNQVRCVYEYGKGCAEAQIGRLYAKGNSGLQSFPFDMRNPLIDKYYWDIDMENCHYFLLNQIGARWGVAVDGIKHYINNRDECLAALSSNRKTAKTEYLKVAYGGNVTLYNEHYKENETAPEGDMTNILTVKKEVETISDLAWAKRLDIQKIVKKNKKTNLNW